MFMFCPSCHAPRWVSLYSNRCAHCIAHRELAWFVAGGVTLTAMSLGLAAYALH